MGIFKRLANMITGGGGGGNEGRFLTIYLLSNRCREPLIAQVDLFNEVSRAGRRRWLLHPQGYAHIGRQTLL